MLKETMLALRVTDMEYAPEICGLIKAAANDLKIAGVRLGGVCVFNIHTATDPDTGEETITVDDHTSIKDELVKTAIKTYVRAHFGSPADWEIGRAHV